MKITGSLTADEPVSIVGTFNGDVLVANHSVTVETGGRVEVLDWVFGRPQGLASGCSKARWSRRT